jgi:hypothetical protein
MGSNAEIIAISQALLALSDAVAETRRALVTLGPAENEAFAKHLEASSAATDRYLEHMQKLVDLIAKSRE